MQRLVSCDTAGVAFSLDPVSGDARRILIDANHGLGESVVGGETAVDHWVLDRDSLEAIETRIAAKTMKTVADTDGIRREDLSGDEAACACLTEAQLREVAGLVLEVERKAAFPQDIEWGFADGKLWLLQARAITTLPERWTREESAERFPTPITPLTWEFVEAGFHDSLKWSLRLMGMPPCPGRWFASFDHYIYGNQNLGRTLLPLALRLRQPGRTGGTDAAPAGRLPLGPAAPGRLDAGSRWLPDRDWPGGGERSFRAE